MTRMQRSLLRLLLPAVCAVPVLPLHAADLRVAAVFTEHMVLQRGTLVPVWGSADAGKRVLVEFAGQKKVAAADAAGRWSVQLDPLAASADGNELVVSAEGHTPLRLGDILVGEVWVCGGQSNMERQLGPRPPQPPLLNWEQEAAGANFPQIRHFEVAHKVLPSTGGDVSGKWVVCSPQSVVGFTAVGYFFGRELHLELGVPIGLLHSSWGGTGVATWTSPEALESTEELREKTSEKLEALGGKSGPAKPSALFSSMIAPLIPCAIKGAIWLQGESGAGISVPYDTLFQVMIQDWRRHWGRGDFPFYFAQLPNGSPVTREAQARALRLPATGMAVTLDVGYARDVHGPDKAPIGKRLARLALVHDYNKGGESSGPLFASAEIEEGRIRIQFTHVAGGLVANDNAPLRYFLVAGEDRKFVAAEARIEGGTVVVSSPAVPRPAAVRYAWVSVAEGCNLFNSAGIPAAPFRTDSW